MGAWICLGPAGTICGMEVIANSERETQDVAAVVGRLAGADTLIALYGQLGSGKTQFVKGLARGLGVPDQRRVCSPTFIIVNEHAGRLTLYHVDAYRLRHWRELEQIGFGELLESGAVVAVEWADHVKPLLRDDRLDVGLEVLGESQRRIRFSATGPASRELLDRVRSAYQANQQQIEK